MNKDYLFHVMEGAVIIGLFIIGMAWLTSFLEPPWDHAKTFGQGMLPLGVILIALFAPLCGIRAIWIGYKTFVSSNRKTKEE